MKLKLKDIFVGMVVVLNDLEDAEFYTIYGVNDTIIALKSVNTTGKISLNEYHYGILQKPTKEQIEFYSKRKL